MYVDETEFTADDGRLLRGVGVLSVPAPIDDGLIERALEKLRADPDRVPSSPNFDRARENLDLTTLRNGHFHASEDSQNAHSPLAKEIRRHVHGNFVAAFIEAGSNTDIESYRSNVMRSIITTLKSRATVTCTFERWGHFASLQAEALMEYARAGLDWSAYSTIMLREFYPRIDVSVEDKRTPGLQVADFLLWSYVQAKFHPHSTKARWAERCGLFVWSEVPIPEGKLQWARCTLNDGSPMDLHDPDSLLPYPVQLDLIDDCDQSVLAESYAFAERILRSALRRPLPSDAEHLRPGLGKSLRDLDDPDRVGPREIQGVARYFLRLFDTVPLYANLAADDPAWLNLLRAKRFMALTLRDELLTGGLTVDFFARMRRARVKDEPTAFGLAPRATNSFPA